MSLRVLKHLSNILMWESICRATSVNVTREPSPSNEIRSVIVKWEKSRSHETYLENRMLCVMIFYTHLLISNRNGTTFELTLLIGPEHQLVKYIKQGKVKYFGHLGGFSFWFGHAIQGRRIATWMSHFKQWTQMTLSRTVIHQTEI